MNDGDLFKGFDKTLSVALANAGLAIVCASEWERAKSEVEAAIGRLATTHEQEVFADAFTISILVKACLWQLFEQATSLKIAETYANFGKVSLYEVLQRSFQSVNDLKIRNIAWRMAAQYPWP